MVVGASSHRMTERTGRGYVTVMAVELREAIRRRRMTRRFDPGRAVCPEVVEEALRHALRAPNAGFSQGWDFVVLSAPDERARFWEATTGREGAGSGSGDPWLAGVSAAPVLVLCCSDPQAYLDRYAEPDKGWADRDPRRWPIPYWDVDTGMAALLMLLTAVDHGLGALFFGVPAPRHDATRTALGIPSSRRLVGVVALGHPLPGPRSPSLSRPRRGLAEAVHHGRW